MPLPIPNTTLTADYADATFAGNDVFGEGFFVIANGTAICIMRHGTLGQAVDGPELFLPPGTYPVVSKKGDPISGLKFKYADASQTPAAQVFGVIYYPTESIIQSGSSFDANISPSGGFTPPGGGSSGVTGDIVWSAAATRTGSVPADGATYDGTVGTYTALWNAIGLAYGGVNQAAFNVPDLRKRSMFGVGGTLAAGANDAAVLGTRGPSHHHLFGREVVSLTPGGTPYSLLGNQALVDSSTTGGGVQDVAGYIALYPFILL